MKYIDQDLDFIFIRVKNKKEEWVSASLRETSTKQFRYWIYSKFEIIIEKLPNNSLRIISKNIKETFSPKWILNSEDRLDIINYLAKEGAVFVMIKRGKVRKNW